MPTLSKVASSRDGHSRPMKHMNRRTLTTVIIICSIFNHIYCIGFIAGKVCDKPMLSSAIFSGSGSTNYNTASITSSGWCASGSAPYLLIDLRKEYHITRVVVMGNKDQTKWSESYLLRYSHDRTLVHHSTSIKVSSDLIDCKICNAVMPN